LNWLKLRQKMAGSMGDVAIARTDWSRSLAAWIARDGLVLVLLFVAWRALSEWHAASGSGASAAALGVAGFVFAYAACYVAHEWGHDLGARLLGAAPARGSIAGVVMPLFDPRAHTRAQFLGLAYGGQIGYIAMAAAIVAAFEPDLAHRAAALGAIAFVVQSLSVDQAALGLVWRGVDPARALREGVTPARLLQRTGIAWGLLALVLAGVHFFGGGLP
jgi:hypothetical protein